MSACKTEPTFTCTLYVGFTVRDTDQRDWRLKEAEDICQEYCDEVGLCVTTTRTNYIYTNGSEPGVAVGFINYPRFPAEPEEIL